MPLHISLLSASLNLEDFDAEVSMDKKRPSLLEDFDLKDLLISSHLLFLRGIFSIDNLFVIWLLFQRTHIPAAHQHRILFWGILGAVVFRGIFIGLGVTLVNAFAPILDIFALFLIYSGIQLIRVPADRVVPKTDTKMTLFLKKHLRWSDRTDLFFVRHEGRLQCTAALMALCLIEAADILFAIDSVPAGLAISKEPFILFSANICAILGLRSLYFFITGPHVPLRKLSYAVPWLLIMIGVQMIAVHWISIPVWVSLLVIIAIPALTLLRR